MPTARVIKRKYYAKNILAVLLLVGLLVVASASPYFWPRVLKAYLKNRHYKKPLKSSEKKKFLNTFYYLKSKGMINISKKNKQIYISLTEKGKKLAGKYQIDDLEIKKPKKWDKKWRVIIFDIKDKQRIKRESLRGKLKELNFYQVQKSVWAHPFSCEEEIKLLREFFGLTQNELKIILAEKIENDAEIKRYYDL